MKLASACCSLLIFLVLIASRSLAQRDTKGDTMTEGQARAQAALFTARLDANAIRNGLDPYGMPKEIGTIADMKPGQSGYTLPWAFSPNYPVFEREGGTASMPIGRDLAGRLWIGSGSLTELIVAERSKTGAEK